MSAITNDIERWACPRHPEEKVKFNGGRLWCLACNRDLPDAIKVVIVPADDYQKVGEARATAESIVEQVLNSQAELQTALGLLRLKGLDDSYIEMRLQASLAMQHALLADLGRPMFQPTQMPEGWTPA